MASFKDSYIVLFCANSCVYRNIAIQYCKQCEWPLCSNCDNALHSHDYRDLRNHERIGISSMPSIDYESALRKQIIAQIEEVSDALDAVCSKINENLNDLKTSLPTKSKEVGEHFAELHQKLGLREAVLKTDLIAKANEKIESLQRQRAMISVVVKNADRTTGWVDDSASFTQRQREVFQPRAFPANLDELVSTLKTLQAKYMRNPGPKDNSDLTVHFDTQSILNRINQYGILEGPPAPVSVEVRNDECVVGAEAKVRVMWDYPSCRKQSLLLTRVKRAAEHTDMDSETSGRSPPNHNYLDPSRVLFLIECAVVTPGRGRGFNYDPLGESAHRRDSAATLASGNTTVAQALSNSTPSSSFYQPYLGHGTSSGMFSPRRASAASHSQMDIDSSNFHQNELQFFHVGQVWACDAWLPSIQSNNNVINEKNSSSGSLSNNRFTALDNGRPSSVKMTPQTMGLASGVPAVAVEADNNLSPSDWRMSKAAGESTANSITTSSGQALLPHQFKAGLNLTGQDTSDRMFYEMDVGSYIGATLRFQVRAVLVTDEGEHEMGEDGSRFNDQSAVVSSRIQNMPADVIALTYPCSRPTLLQQIKVPDRFEVMREFRFESPFDGGGVLYWIGTHQGKLPYRNPHSEGFVFAEMSSYGDDFCSPYKFVSHGQEGVNYTKEETNSWMGLDLGKHRKLLPNYYCLRHGNADGSNVLRNWVLQGRVSEKSKWVILRRHDEDMGLAATPYSVSFWPITVVPRRPLQPIIVETSGLTENVSPKSPMGVRARRRELEELAHQPNNRIARDRSGSVTVITDTLRRLTAAANTRRRTSSDHSIRSVPSSVKGLNTVRNDDDVSGLSGPLSSNSNFFFGSFNRSVSKVNFNAHDDVEDTGQPGAVPSWPRARSTSSTMDLHALGSNSSIGRKSSVEEIWNTDMPQDPTSPPRPSLLSRFRSNSSKGMNSQTTDFASTKSFFAAQMPAVDSSARVVLSTRSSKGAIQGAMYSSKEIAAPSIGASSKGNETNRLSLRIRGLTTGIFGQRPSSSELGDPGQSEQQPNGSGGHSPVDTGRTNNESSSSPTLSRMVYASMGLVGGPGERFRRDSYASSDRSSSAKSAVIGQRSSQHSGGSNSPPPRSSFNAPWPPGARRPSDTRSPATVVSQTYAKSPATTAVDEISSAERSHASVCNEQDNHHKAQECLDKESMKIDKNDFEQYKAASIAVVDDEPFDESEAVISPLTKANLDAAAAVASNTAAPGERSNLQLVRASGAGRRGSAGMFSITGPLQSIPEAAYSEVPHSATGGSSSTSASVDRFSLDLPPRDRERDFIRESAQSVLMVSPPSTGRSSIASEGRKTSLLTRLFSSHDMEDVSTFDLPIGDLPTPSTEIPIAASTSIDGSIYSSGDRVSVYSASATTTNLNNDQLLRRLLTSGQLRATDALGAKASPTPRSVPGTPNQQRPLIDASGPISSSLPSSTPRSVPSTPQQHRSLPKTASNASNATGGVNNNVLPSSSSLPFSPSRKMFAVPEIPPYKSRLQSTPVTSPNPIVPPASDPSHSTPLIRDSSDELAGESSKEGDFFKSLSAKSISTVVEDPPQIGLDLSDRGDTPVVSPLSTFSENPSQTCAGLSDPPTPVLPPLNKDIVKDQSPYTSSQDSTQTFTPPHSDILPLPPSTALDRQPFKTPHSGPLQSTESTEPDNQKFKTLQRGALHLALSESFPQLDSQPQTQPQWSMTNSIMTAIGIGTVGAGTGLSRSRQEAVTPISASRAPRAPPSQRNSYTSVASVESAGIAGDIKQQGYPNSQHSSAQPSRRNSQITQQQPVTSRRNSALTEDHDGEQNQDSDHGNGNGRLDGSGQHGRNSGPPTSMGQPIASHIDHDDESKGYRFFRIVQHKGLLSKSTLCCSGIELYGTLVEELT